MNEKGIAKTETTSPAHLLQIAIEKGVDVIQLEKLMDLQERWNKQQAHKSFLFAKSKFQGECPELKKTKKVDFPSKTGGRVNYAYAPLGSIAVQIKKLLQDCGLSYHWELEDKTEDIFCKCIVSHLDGHSEQTIMSAKKDATGSKNEIQMRASTITYLQRYTLIAALGISTADEDIDGKGANKTKEEIKIELPQEIKEELLRMNTVKELDKFCIENCKQFQKLVSFRDLVAPLRKKMFAKEFPNKKYSVELP